MRVTKNNKIKQHLLDQISDGSLAVGSRAPSERELSKMFAVHHTTAEKALRELAYEGYIERRRGSGSYIRRIEQVRTGKIAFIINNANSGFFSPLIILLQDHLREQKKQLLFFSTSESFMLERSYIQQLLAKKQVDGFIIVPAHDVSHEERRKFYNGLKEQKVPFVLVFPPTSQPDFNTIQTDDEKGIYDATNFLIAQGHEKIGFISHRIPNNIIAKNCLVGYRKSLREANLPINEGSIIKVAYPSMENGFKAADIILKMSRRPTAFVVVADLLAIGIAIRLREHGIKIPEHIHLIGHGNTGLSKPENCNLSSIDDSLEQVCEQAVKVLMRDIKQVPRDPVHIVISPKLIVRNAIV
jgi:DNA-binding LacI/PurR family transcriptional regulator